MSYRRFTTSNPAASGACSGVSSDSHRLEFFACAWVLNAGYMLAEFIGGVVLNSLALIVDAFQILFDGCGR